MRVRCLAGGVSLHARLSSRFTRARQLKVFNLVLKEAINCTSQLVKLPGKSAACVHCLAMHERFIRPDRSDLREKFAKQLSIYLELMQLVLRLLLWDLLAS